MMSKFSRINLYTFLNYVQKALGDFRVVLTSDDMEEEGLDGQENRVGEEVEMPVPSSVTTSMPSAIEDYVFRGGSLTDYSVYDICRNTECVVTSAEEREKYGQSISERGTQDDLIMRGSPSSLSTPGNHHDGYRYARRR